MAAKRPAAPKTTKPAATPKPSPRPSPAPVRIPGHATKPSYQRSKVEKAVDEVGKAIRRVPSDVREGARQVKGAVDKIVEGGRKVKKGLTGK